MTHFDSLSNGYIVCGPDEKFVQMIRILLQERALGRQEEGARKFILYFATCATVDYFFKVSAHFSFSRPTGNRTDAPISPDHESSTHSIRVLDPFSAWSNVTITSFIDFYRLCRFTRISNWNLTLYRRRRSRIRFTRCRCSHSD